MKKGNNAWNKPLEIWEIMALSSASPKSYPILTSPFDYEEEKRRFEPVDKVEEQNDKESNKDFLNRPIKKQRCRQQKGLLLPKNFIKEWEKQRTESNYPSFRGNISSPFATATAKPCMYQRKPNES